MVSKKGYQKQSARRSAFTMVEIMIVVLIIGILLSVSAPNFVKARETTREKSCIENLWKIQFAKDTFMMANNLDKTTPASEFTDARLFGVNGFVQAKPACPGGGTYTINNGDVFPTCDYKGGNIHTISAH